MNIQTLRKFSLKLDVSGTATVIDNTKLYVGSFGFVGLKVYVPVTQNRTPNSEPLCTVHRTVIDLAGNRKQFNLDKYNLLYVGVKQIEDKQYMVFESLLPKAFTDTEGELELVFNYCELTTNLLGESVVVSRLATNIFRTTVAAGGINNTELNTDLKSQDAAQINANTIAIKSLIDDVENLVKPIDNTLANQVGTAELVIDQITGGLKAINIKGETGATGDTGLTPNITANATPLPAGASPTVEKSGTIDNPIFTFGLPKGDKGNTGEPFTISKIYSSIVAMNEGYSTDNVTIGGFVVIDTGSAEDEENGRLYIKGETQYTYIVDLSGMQGFTGVGISQIVYDSTLTDGSFKYKVTLTNNEVYYFVAPKGEMGNTGQAATITVGNTTTLPAGSVATIQERGTAQDRILDFGIPKGADGTGTGNTTVYVGGVLTETVEFSSNPQLQLNAITSKAETNRTELQAQITQNTTTVAIKANKATTLAGYGITDAYTKFQVDTNLLAKANKDWVIMGFTFKSGIYGTVYIHHNASLRLINLVFKGVGGFTTIGQTALTVKSMPTFLYQGVPLRGVFGYDYAGGRGILSYDFEQNGDIKVYPAIAAQSGTWPLPGVIYSQSIVKY